MSNERISVVKGEYLRLDELEKIDFIAWLHKEDAHKVAYAAMGESERKFHTPPAKRDIDKTPSNISKGIGHG